MKINFKKPRLNEDVPLFWSLHKFFIHRLKEVLWAERELSATVLSKIIYNVGSPNLSFVIKDYKKLTKLHAAKTVKILNDAGITARGKKSPGMQSLMHEFTILFEKRKKRTGKRCCHNFCFTKNTALSYSILSVAGNCWQNVR